MLVDKEGIRRQIEALPLFEKREVFVATRPGEKIPIEETQKQRHVAICEEGKTEALCYPGPGYALVQFKDMFSPLLDSINEEVKGNIVSYGGFAMLRVFPQNPNLREGDTNYGILAYNSVDMTSSLIIRFCIEKGGIRISVPPKVAGLKKQHSGKVGNIVNNYISMIGKVKVVWHKIVEDFPKWKLTPGTDAVGDHVLTIDSVAERLEIGDRLKKVIKEKAINVEKNGGVYTLWDMFVDCVNTTAEKEFTSDVHRQKHIDKLCEAIFGYSFVLSL